MGIIIMFLLKLIKVEATYQNIQDTVKAVRRGKSTAVKTYIYPTM